ncbi:Zinc transporter 9 [Operophtera brumata]|uniref:Zinc transporter 9 n=1 Tax=Operophtera brumata TaxID=104452 RepID=A0A0L7K453_OPEBR|nr:Zinc transporter 9 [Operophtera brumata]
MSARWWAGEHACCYQPVTRSGPHLRRRVQHPGGHAARRSSLLYHPEQCRRAGGQVSTLAATNLLRGVDPTFDAVCSILVGTLLGGVASFIILSNVGALVGR